MTKERGNKPNTKFEKFPLSGKHSIIVPADKYKNFYTCDVGTYKKLRNNNIEKEDTKS